MDKIEQLHILRKLYETITVTPEVVSEFGKPLPEWVKTGHCSDKNYQRILETTLDPGEASIIALALQYQECLLIIDDFKGRKIAEQLGIRITGTLGILISAKEKGFIAHIKLLLEKIKQTNFRINRELEYEVLRKSKEL